jgi:hypothetical protein
MECFTTLTPAGPDMVRSESSIKKFDDRGNPIDLSKTWRIGHKNLPFKQYNFDRSKQDVRPSFAQYLKGEGLENLVPLQNLVP